MIRSVARKIVVHFKKKVGSKSKQKVSFKKDTKMCRVHEFT